MATKDVNKEKEDTTAQGADSASTVDQAKDSSKELVEQENDSSKELNALIESHKEVIESNNAVIESNNEVIAAVASFRENASRVVKEIMQEAQSNGTSELKNVAKPSAEISINKKATYVVAKGKKFQSSVSGEMITEGTELNGFETERLKSLIAQGIAVEKSED